MAGTKMKPKTMECSYPECNWIFDCKYKFERHVKSHTKEKPFKCEKCGKSFSYGYNLKVHLKSHDTNAKVRSVKSQQYDLHLTCPIKRCIKKFKYEEDLQQHIVGHASQNKCNVPGCGKEFQRPCLLKQHLLIHSGVKPFQCDECPKAFVAAQNLKLHKLVHANKKEFVCDVEKCGRSFNSPEYLKVHERTHEKAKKYACPVETCDKLLVCKETLKVHMKRHENHREYVCDFENCKKSYLTLSNLNFHKKSHTSNIYEKKTDLSGNARLKENENVINVNDFINISLFEKKSTKKTNSSDNQPLYTEDLLAAAFGEIACNEYMNNDKIEEIRKPLTCITSSGDDDVGGNDFDDSSILQQSSEENRLQATMIEDIQFQEEFPANIYMHSVNNYRTFITGHDYQQSQYDIPSLPSPVIDKDDEFTASNSLVGNDMDYISETSMELSTGHLEIDGGYFCSSLCLPDHVYSHQIP